MLDNLSLLVELRGVLSNDFHSQSPMVVFQQRIRSVEMTAHSSTVLNMKGFTTHNTPQQLSTMSALFCCSSISPYRPRQLDHEAKFTTFMRWAGLQTIPSVPVDGLLVSSAPYAVQLVRQIGYGPLESTRYFVPASNGSDDFAEATEDDLLQSNFEKLNSYLIMNSRTNCRSRTNTSAGTRTSSAKSTINSLKSISINRTLPLRIIGRTTSRDRQTVNRY